MPSSRYTLPFSARVAASLIVKSAAQLAPADIRTTAAIHVRISKRPVLSFNRNRSAPQGTKSQNPMVRSWPANGSTLHGGLWRGNPSAPIAWNAPPSRSGWRSCSSDRFCGLKPDIMTCRRSAKSSHRDVAPSPHRTRAWKRPVFRRRDDFRVEWGERRAANVCTLPSSIRPVNSDRPPAQR
jgi:hypothetical protein